MKTIAFVKSDKENENRIAILPCDSCNIKNINQIYIEEGYGKINGYEDDDYKKMGFNVVTREEALEKDIIIEPKIGDAKYLKDLKNKTICGWIHAVQNRNITDILINNKLTAFAWEEMFDENRHLFWKNNEIAGEAAVLHALLQYGALPYNYKVAILGNGNTSRGAYKIFSKLGAEVYIYDKFTEELFKKEFNNYDIIVNAILWDVNRKDHIIYKKDLKKMKKNSLIIDISCDKEGAIESSIPTTIDNPTYIVDGVVHYVVDHTPSLLYKTVSIGISKEISKIVDLLIEEKYNDMLKKSKIIENGCILDKKIIDYQNRR